MAEPAARTVETGRPSALATVWTQTRFANRSFWRTPIAAFFTLVFPLIFLVLLSALIGNEPVQPGSDVRISQFITPAIAAFAATTASFTTLATGLSIDRDRGVLKRVRGTPLPPWMFLAGRVASAVWIAFLSVVVMVAVGVAFFGVRIVWASLPAAIVTLAVGIGAFAALAIVVVALSPSAAATQGLTNGIILPLAFISDVFGQSDDLPEWLQTVGWVFPLKHFANGLQDAFDPFAGGPGLAWDHLAVLVAWGVVALLVALRLFRWESPRGGGAQAPAPARAPRAAGGPRLRPVEEVGRPGALALAAGQVGYGVRKVFRSTVSVFFVVAFPVILLLLLPLAFGDTPLDFRGGIPLTQFLAPVLAVFGAAQAAYADFSERVARDRDDGILKRLHGTPLPSAAYLGGRVAAALAVAFASLAVTLVVGVALLDVEVVWRALPGVAVTVVVGIACFACLGLAIAAVAPNAEAVPPIANATLLPLSFFSDIFLIGDLPAWMDTVGWIFPLKHFANALADGFNPTVPGVGLFADHLAVMAAWGVAGALLALRFWTWEPRPKQRRRSRRRGGSATAATAQADDAAGAGLGAR